MTFPLRSPNHYSLLEISEDATPDEIQQAFRRRAKQFHPDLNGSRHAREAFLSVTEAYHILRDRERRAAYDDELDEALFLTWDENRNKPVMTAAPRPRPQTPRAFHWVAGLGLAGAVGVAALVGLAGPEQAGVPAERIALASRNVEQVAMAADTAADMAEPAKADVLPAQPAVEPLTAGAPLFALPEETPVAASPPRPVVAQAAAANEPPALDNWQASATQDQMPPVSALDVLAEVPPTAPLPAATPAAKVAPRPLAKRTVAALVSQVRKTATAPVRVNPYQAKRYYAAVQAAKARYAAVQAARARYLAVQAAKARFAAAQAAKARMSRAQHRVVRKAWKRRYAAY